MTKRGILLAAVGVAGALAILASYPGLRDKLPGMPAPLTSGEPAKGAAGSLMVQASEARNQGKVDEAIALYEKVMREYPNAVDDSGDEDELYSARAEASLRELNCLKKRGGDFATSSKDEIQKLVTDALKSGDTDRLLKYASCEFTVGLSESDVGGQIDPEKAVPTLIEIGKALEWQDGRKEFGTQFNVASKDDMHELLFRQMGSSWSWVGYATASEEELDKFSFR